MVDIAGLEAELVRQERINGELRRELAEIENGVLRMNRTLDDCRQKAQDSLNDSAQKLQEGQKTGQAAIELQAEINVLYQRFKEMELANKRIRECNNKKYYDFANYRKVRKIVQGMMDNLDLNMVSDGVIYRSVEEQHLKSPDYWLTCALLAVMAWRNDDRELAERAIQVAVQLDKKSSAVFFLLFNLRMDRQEAALKWLRCYEECQLKGSDHRTFLLLFALMSRYYDGEETGRGVQEEIRSFVDDVVRDCAAAAGYSEEDMTARARKGYDRMDSREPVDYPMLQKYCQSYSVLARALQAAKGNGEILAFLKRTVYVDTAKRNSFVKNFMEELVNQENDTEKSVYDEIRFQELVIRCQGDREQALRIFQETRQHDETQLNLIAEMLDWVFMEDGELDDQWRLNMLTLTKPIHASAVEEHTRAYREPEKNRLPIRIEAYEGSVDLSRKGEGEADARRFYEQQRDEACAQVKNLSAYIGFGVGAAAAVGAIFASPALLILTALAGGYGLFKLLSNGARRRTLSEICEKSVAACSEVMRRLEDEHSRYLQELEHYDQLTASIGEVLAEI